MYKEFFKKANKKFNNKYDYSKSDYVNTNTEIIIRCSIHGEFVQKPINHLRYGCVQCARDQSIKKKKESFIERANKKHNNKYDYSKLEYINSYTKSIIICSEHGKFEQTPQAHLKYGCKQCGHIQSGKIISCSKSEFIKRANKKHNDKYDYSKVEYRNLSSRIKIICPEHGEFIQKANNHLKYGCQKCGIKSLCSDNDLFMTKAIKKHGYKYDYSKVDYKNSYSKITIICPEHGEFEQAPSCHLNGRGCAKCSEHNVKDFIKKARAVHGFKYDYSMVEYKNKIIKVKIICPKHGEFEQRPYLHIAGKNCQKCVAEGFFCNTNEFIEKSRIKHGNKYNYSKVNYKNNRIKVIINCKIHGDFEQVPMDHLAGCGCPKCEIIVSSGHQEIIDFIESMSNTELRINDRQAISPYELDIYMPEYNFAIEYHGSYWHSYDKKETAEERKKHQFKHQLCLDGGIKLFQIFENEWRDLKTREILKSKIKLSLGMCNRIFARKCIVKELDNKEYKEFVEICHLQGHKSASVKLGLFYKNKLVSVMSFNKHQKYEWEITRFVSKLDTIIVGGASKVFKYFMRHYDPHQILTYADRRYSDGNLYKKLGFKLDGVTSSNYFYLKNNTLFSRQQFQKHKLRDKLETFDPELTEAENMFNNGYRRLWDAGHFRFLSKIK